MDQCIKDGWKWGATVMREVELKKSLPLSAPPKNITQ